MPLLRHYLAGRWRRPGRRLPAGPPLRGSWSRRPPSARKTLNRNRPLPVELTAGQVWNLEKPEAPADPARPITKAGGPAANRTTPTSDSKRASDFATMTWTARVNGPAAASPGQGSTSRVPAWRCWRPAHHRTDHARRRLCKVESCTTARLWTSPATAITWPEAPAVTPLAGQRERPTPEDSVGGSGTGSVGPRLGGRRAPGHG
jgi:hypothetical protein